MSQTSEYKTPYFGLRDFLFYFTPGAVAFLSILIGLGDFPNLMREYSSVTSSLVAILAAYFLGHAIYPLNYPLRKLLRRRRECAKKAKPGTPEKDQKRCTDECPGFKDAYFRIIEEHPDYYSFEVSRFRSLARFASAMILPCFSLAVGMLAALVRANVFGSQLVNIATPLALGGLFIYGFVFRYRLYQDRFIDLVILGEKCCHRNSSWTDEAANIG